MFVDTEPNAFALPGGKVGVNTGIFTVARNQDQLAARDRARNRPCRFAPPRRTPDPQAGAQGALELVGALLGSRYGEGAANAAVQGGSVLAQTGFLLPGSRAQESEADVVGQQLMAKAGFDPREAVNLWQNMIAAGRQPPAAVAVHASGSAEPPGRIAATAPPALMPVFEQARASGREPPAVDWPAANAHFPAAFC